MKKLLTATLVFCFCTADAGLFSAIKNVSGKAATFLDKQVASRTAGSTTTNGTLISNPTLQTELSNVLNNMYEEAKIVRRKNLLKPKTLYYASNLCITLQKCINAPSSTSANISIIENYIKELQSRSVDVTNLNLQLATLKTSSANFNNSTISIGDRTINQTVNQEMIVILTEMNAEAAQISSTYLTDLAVVQNSTLLQRKLQECIANPTNTSASIDTMSGYIQKLQESSINVTSLTQKLALLKGKAAQLINSGTSVDYSKINSNVLGEFLTASNEVQSEISKIQNANSANATLVSYSGQINNLLTNCNLTFVVTQNHISALNQYALWVQGQGIDVTSLNQKLVNFNEKVVNLNNAATSANTTNAGAVGSAATAASTGTTTNTVSTTVSTGTAAMTATAANTTNVGTVGTATVAPAVTATNMANAAVSTGTAATTATTANATDVGTIKRR
ncbi:MAG: hypothetical protein J5821_02705 [Alphaproteobacteria bacterium]|nr:hypothetical protein [Alphaproteobacteria bacterium]